MDAPKGRTAHRDLPPKGPTILPFERRLRRPEVAAQAERRSAIRRASIGGDVRSIRKRRRWSQEELAERADLGRDFVSRLERGLGPVDLEKLERVAFALDVPLVVALGKDRREEVADAGHLAMQEIVLRHARAAGFERGFEIPTRPNEPWRSADVALASERRHEAIDVECWNTFGDIGSAARSSGRKEAEILQAAVARWGGDARVGVVWVLRDTARNRQLIERYPEVFATRFNGSSRAWVATLTSGAPVPQGWGLVWCDVSPGRLYEWRKRGA